MTPLKIRLKTLTPLWTGGVEAGKVDRIHETGILGSLRWWYEAIVRGLGGKVCDPTTPSCIYDPDKPDNGLCDVCRVFGATGWRRRFRLTILDQTQPDTSSPKQIGADRPINPKTNRKPTWWFPDHPRSGNLTIQIQSLAQDFPAEVIGGLLQFMADWAALGARAQMGFGIVEPVSGRIDTRQLYDWLVATTGSHKNSDPALPSLQNLFLARIQLQHATDQDTFNLKYDLRQLFAGKKNVDLRHFIMGTVKGGRMAAKVKVSRPYDGLMRVWGWIPQKANVYQGSWDREAVVNAMHNHLQIHYNLQVWREINSPRDTVAPSNSDVQVFLQSLLEIEEEDDAT